MSTGVVSLFPKETGLVPLKATCHTPRNHTPSPGNEGRGLVEVSACVGCEGATLCLSDVPLGPTTVSFIMCAFSFSETFANFGRRKCLF